MKHNEIPQEFQIKELTHQSTYLSDGELIEWKGATSEVYSTISSTVSSLFSLPPNPLRERRMKRNCARPRNHDSEKRRVHFPPSFSQSSSLTNRERERERERKAIFTLAKREWIIF